MIFIICVLADDENFKPQEITVSSQSATSLRLNWNSPTTEGETIAYEVSKICVATIDVDHT